MSKLNNRKLSSGSNGLLCVRNRKNTDYYKINRKTIIFKHAVINSEI